MKITRRQLRRIIKEVAYNRRKAFLADLYGSDFDPYFKERGLDDEAYKRMASAGRKMKTAFNAHADRQYLDSLKYVHWTKNRRRALAMLAPKIMKAPGVPNSRDELSAAAYLPGEVAGESPGFGKYGVLISGYVTLLSNDMNSLQTGYIDGYKKADPQRVASSGANKGIGYAFDADIVLSAEDWDPQGGSGSFSLGNEALVDNWEVQGLIVPDDEYDTFVSFMDKIYEKTGEEYLLYKASQLS